MGIILQEGHFMLVLNFLYNLIKLKIGKKIFLFLLLGLMEPIYTLEKKKFLFDGSGEKLRIDKTYSRILSTTIGSDSILYEILYKNSPKKMVGFSKFSKKKEYSSIADSIPESMVFHHTAEELVLRKPDLVILASYTNSDLKHLLKKLNINYFVLAKFGSIEDIKANIKTLGLLANKPKEAEDLINSINLKLAKIKKCVGEKPKKSIPLVINFSPDNTIMGIDTTFNDIAKFSGSKNIAETLNLKGWPKISDEKLAALKPNFIVVSDHLKNRDIILKKINSQNSWKQLVNSARPELIFVPPVYFSSVSQNIVEAILKVHEKIYGKC